MALAVTGCYIQRDLAECGLQLFLLSSVERRSVGAVARSAGTVRLVVRAGRRLQGDAGHFLAVPDLETAMAHAGWMAASSVIFCLMPAVYLGWQKDVALHQKWFGFITHTLALEDPSENGVEVPVLRNQSLPLAWRGWCKIIPWATRCI